MTTVGVVAAHYQPEYVAQSLRAMEAICLKAKPLHTVVVANRPDTLDNVRATLGEHGGSVTLVAHDNSDHEFGAYQAGLDQLLAKADPDWVLILNDTFSIHKNFAAVTRERLLDQLALDVDHPAIVGQVDSLARSYEIRGARTHRWIRSNIFALNRAALAVLQGRIFRAEVRDMVVDTGDMDFFFSPSMDPVLRRHLLVWLFRIAPGPQWYAAEPLTTENSNKMMHKARSILFEKHLSATLDQNAAEFVDLNRLPVSKKVVRKLEDHLFDFKSRFAG